MKVLQYRIDDMWLIDLGRILTIAMAGALMVYILSLLRNWRRLPYDLARKLRYLSLLGYAIVTAAQEVSQLGKPMLVWRLPLLFICTILALLGNMLPDMRAARPRPTKPVKRFQWPE